MRLRSALLTATFTMIATAAFAQTGYIIDSDGTNHLWRLDLTTGVATDIGPLNYSQVEGLTTSSTGVLYGVDDVTDTLVTINTTTGVATAVGIGNGNLGVDVSDVGLTFDGVGNLWLTAEIGNDFYSVNPTTGVATLVNGSQANSITGLAACGTTLWGLDDGGDPQLVTINPVTGDSTVIGSLGGAVTVPDDGALAMGPSLILYGIPDHGAGTTPLFTLNKVTGLATVIANVTDGGGGDLHGIESFTLAEGPAASCNAPTIPALDLRGLAALMAALAATGFWVMRRA